MKMSVVARKMSEGTPKTVGVESPQLFSENAHLVIFTANIHKSPETYIT